MQKFIYLSLFLAFGVFAQDIDDEPPRLPGGPPAQRPPMQHTTRAHEGLYEVTLTHENGVVDRDERIAIMESSRRPSIMISVLFGSSAVLQYLYRISAYDEEEGFAESETSITLKGVSEPLGTPSQFEFVIEKKSGELSGWILTTFTNEIIQVKGKRFVTAPDEDFLANLSDPAKRLADDRVSGTYVGEIRSLEPVARYPGQGKPVKGTLNIQHVKGTSNYIATFVVDRSPFLGFYEGSYSRRTGTLSLIGGTFSQFPIKWFLPCYESEDSTCHCKGFGYSTRTGTPVSLSFKRVNEVTVPVQREKLGKTKPRTKT